MSMHAARTQAHVQVPTPNDSNPREPPPELLAQLRALPDPTIDAPPTKQYSNGFLAFRALFNSIVVKENLGAATRFQGLISTETSERWKDVKAAGRERLWKDFASRSRRDCEPNDDSRAKKKKRAQEHAQEALELGLSHPNVATKTDSPPREPSSGKARRSPASSRIHAPVPTRHARATFITNSSQPESSTLLDWPYHIDTSYALASRVTQSQSSDSASPYTPSFTASPTSTTETDAASSSYSLAQLQWNPAPMTSNFAIQNSLGAFSPLPGSSPELAFPSSTVRDDRGFIPGFPLHASAPLAIPRTGYATFPGNSYSTSSSSWSPQAQGEQELSFASSHSSGSSPASSTSASLALPIDPYAYPAAAYYEDNIRMGYNFPSWNFFLPQATTDIASQGLNLSAPLPVPSSQLFYPDFSYPAHDA